MPNTTASPMGELPRFQNNPIALTEGTEELFLQVRVPAGKVGAFRFLRWKDVQLDSSQLGYQMTCHLFGSKPQMTKDTSRRNLTGAVWSNLYVDYHLGFWRTIQDAKLLAIQTRLHLQWRVFGCLINRANTKKYLRSCSEQKSHSVFFSGLKLILKACATDGMRLRASRRSRDFGASPSRMASG